MISRVKFSSRAPTFAPFLMSAMLIATLVPHCAGAEIAFDELERFVAKALREWEVPGLALAVIKDDRVVFAKGFGVRKLGDDNPVDPETLFAIGSASKAFTAAALAMLIDDGKLNWDDAATKYLPGLQLFDPYVTRELSVRDMLCHRCGLPRGDKLWYGTAYSRDEILTRARYLKSEWSLRSHFGYQNIMFLAAGEIVPRVAGVSWDSFVKQQLFLPLGMKSSNTSTTDLVQSTNVATPHIKFEDNVVPIAWRNIDNVGPAGSINSNANDMAQWVRFQLGNGTLDGKRLISSVALREMQSPQMIIQRDEDNLQVYSEAHFLAYGLGWFLHDFAGRKIVEHGGAIDGMRSQVALVPEEKLGVVILTNRGGSGLPTAMMFHIFDLYLKTEKHDRSGEGLARVKKLEEKAAEAMAKQETERAKDTKPSLPLESYVGKFTDKLYGEIEVRSDGGKLAMHRPAAFVADLEHWHYDTFRAKYRDRAIEPHLMTFRLDIAGNVASLEIPQFAEFVNRSTK
jgi:CubicO group peptidase (beta-lactamase class C family)